MYTEHSGNTKQEHGLLGVYKPVWYDHVGGDMVREENKEYNWTFQYAKRENKKKEQKEEY